MNPQKRVAVNTLAQNIRAILNICLSLYSTRIVLDVLGVVDYGIFSLVGGIIAMLGFITNALVVSTQRYLSFLFGRGNLEDVRKVFSNSLMLHIALGLLLVIVFALFEPLIFNLGLLKVQNDRISVTSIVFFLMIGSLYCSILTAPYRALFIARENIVYISIIDVLDGVFKFALVFLLYCVTFDRLIAYSLIMVAVMLFKLIAFVIYAKINYKESCLIPHLKDYDVQVLKSMSNFAGWTIYSTACIVGRTQGMAVVLNHFFGTIINTAYGIAMQVSSSIQFIAQSVQNAMSPQIIIAEGNGNRQKMLSLSETASKFSFLLLALVVIPLTFEMPDILKVWLKAVPNYAVLFCRFVIISSLCDQLTIGLGTANQAIGRIRTYSLVVNTIKILTLPISWICLIIGFPVEATMWCYLLLEIICAIVRIPFLKATAGLCVIDFFKNVFARVVPSVVVMIIICVVIISFVDVNYRFLLTVILCIILSIPAIWYTGLTKSERKIVRGIINKR